MAKETIIQLKNLKMNFGSKPVLNGINLDIHSGEIIGYIGPNGAGKSTTVKIMLGLLGGYSGEILIFGEDISKGNGEYKKRIGYVPEIANVYDSLTAKEYLTFVAQLYRIDYDKANYKGKQLMKILGIDKAYNSRISTYSKGMKQKLLIISSLLHNPDILFLDEPLSGLDANSVMIVKEILQKLSKEGKTIFYSSHIMDVVEKISNRIILLKDGDIAADGIFNELKEKCMEGSLEDIFNQLTGFSEYEKLAEDFTALINEV